MSKLKSNLSISDAEILYRTATIHADFNTDFGVFCASLASLMVQVFDAFKDIEQDSECIVSIERATLATIKIMENYEVTERILNSPSEATEINAKLSKQIMKIIAQMNSEHSKTS